MCQVNSTPVKSQVCVLVFIVIVLLSRFSKHPQVAHLEVVIPPRIMDEESSTDLAVPEGGSVKLQCAAEGFPA